MPLGDSITYDTGSHIASYRYELFRLALEHQRKLDFVGSRGTGPELIDGQPFPRGTEGHPGWTIDDGGGRLGLYPEVTDWLQSTPPDIVVLMIGTNDLDIDLDPTNAPARLGLLLDRIAATTPLALIVLAKIVPTTDDAANLEVHAFNAAMPALVATRVEQGKHVILVDMYEALASHADYKTALMNDKLHPNDAGLTVMAETWWAAIGDLLPH